MFVHLIHHLTHHLYQLRHYRIEMHSQKSLLSTNLSAPNIIPLVLTSLGLEDAVSPTLPNEISP